jgi:dihydropteroate synthase
VILSARDHTLEIDPAVPLIMGIVNVGYDSVADSTSLPTLAEQLEFALAQVHNGAHIIDIGVQSGRTDTPEISPARELERLEPLVSELSKLGVLVSVDTWRAEVADGAVQAGAGIINDVSGLADPAIAEVAANTGAGLVIMHTRAKPKREHFPAYEDVVADVHQFLQAKVELAEAHGVGASQVLLDPGPDFAKTPTQSIQVLRELSGLQRLERPILLAVSRKYFLGMLTGEDPENRLPGTLAAIGHGVAQGANILRVHDVAAVAQFLAVRSALHTTGEPDFKGDACEERLKWIPARARDSKL